LGKRPAGKKEKESRDNSMQTPITRKTGQVVRLAMLILTLMVWLGPVSPGALAQPGGSPPPALWFIENVGQFPVSAGGETVRFQANSRQATISLTDSALWFTFLNRLKRPRAMLQSPSASSPGAASI
jgi:hypothetical protein